MTFLDAIILAIIEGLIVAVAGQRFVIPTLSVRESFRPHLESITTVHGRGELVDVRGRQVPLLRLVVYKLVKLLLHHYLHWILL